MTCVEIKLLFKVQQWGTWELDLIQHVCGFLVLDKKFDTNTKLAL
jgi:hypothetical protein